MVPSNNGTLRALAKKTNICIRLHDANHTYYHHCGGPLDVTLLSEWHPNNLLNEMNTKFELDGDHAAT